MVSGMTDVASSVAEHPVDDLTDEEVDGDEPSYWLPRPSGRTLAALAMGALAFDLVFRAPVGLVTAVSLGLLIGAAFMGRWVTTTAGRVCLAISVGPLVMLMVRASWWLVPLNVIAVLGLVIVALELRDEPHAVTRAAGRLLRPTPAMFSLISWPGLLLATMSPVLRLLPNRLAKPTAGRQPGSFARGLIITVPVVFVLVLLLGSSDALFGSLLTMPAAPDQAVSHIGRLAAGVALTAMLATRALRRVVEPELRVTPVLGSTELTMLLGAITAVYAIFVTVQVVAAVAGAAYVQETTGLTVAEYARSGFFQLLAAAAFTLAVLLAGKRHASRDADKPGQLVAILNQTTVALTLATVAVAVRRLLLYEAAFGLTMLRLYTVVFALFIGVVFVLTAIHLGERLPFDHFTGVLGVAFGFLMLMNIANPEAIVAGRNLDRFATTSELDLRYLVDDLGPDSVPRILEQVSDSPEGTRIRKLLCFDFDNGRPDHQLRHYNRSRVEAFDLLEAICP